MKKIHTLKALCMGLALAAAGMGAPVLAQSKPGISAQQRTEAHFRTVRAQPPQLWAFLKDMPKGGDLHSHLSGAIYAESMIGWAAEDGLCVDTKTLTVVKPPCDAAPGLVAAKDAQLDGLTYRRMIDAWSMRNAQTSGLSGHDQFFDSFGKFGAANKNRGGDMLAEVASRAAGGNVSYLELMLTPGGSEVSKVATKAGWNDDFAKMRTAMLENGMVDATKAASDELKRAEARKAELLRCGSAQPAPGCAVSLRYLYQVLRGLPKEIVFAQMLAGFELASRADSQVVGLNLVMPEDALVPMRDFSLHMRLLDYLHSVYPKVQVTLHAGELAPGLVPPEGLRFHIRQSIEQGHATRIGHGVAIMQEDDAVGLLKRMARDKIMVEICLTSNTGILGVSGTQHPLATYLKYGVPTALATDDEGVSRSEMTHEYVKAVQEQNISYRQLKTMARNSLQYAFVEGGALWKDVERGRAVAECAGNRPGIMKVNARCERYLEQSPKARLQWQLEDALVKFERKF
ncbi:MAG: adenosine deaminase [Pseudomonadota bacterium]